MRWSDVKKKDNILKSMRQMGAGMFNQGAIAAGLSLKSFSESFIE